MLRVVTPLLLLCAFGLSAQEKQGIAGSNYYSSHIIYTNPSSSVDSKTYMQLNLVGTGVSVFNNMAYLPWFSIWRLRRHPGEIQLPKQSTPKFKKFLYANAELDGPAFVISRGKIGAGIFARARTVMDVSGIPWQFASLLFNQNAYTEFPKQDKINYKNIVVSSMSWLEYGLNFGTIYKQEHQNLITIGGNLKYITGINILYANLSRLNGFYTDSLVRAEDISGRLRYNTPAFNSGKGWAMDIGITYKKMLKAISNYQPHTKASNCTTTEYKYKAALALRDAGYIRFTKGGQKATLNAAGEFRKHVDTTEELFKARLNFTSSTGNILAALPTNLLAQFDWNFENRIYLNALLVKSILPRSLTGVRSSNFISVCPRYETKNLELAMPITFHHFLYPQLGFAFRVRSFVLGFDNLVPLLFMKPRTYGMGIYFNLGISLFKSRACQIRERAVACPPNTMGGASFKSKNRKLFKLFKKKKK